MSPLDWRPLFPDAVAAELVRRWSEPHRHYHGITHLVHGLHVLDALEASPLERIAFWFHDAFHFNNTPRDEQVSAGLAGVLLDGVLGPADVRELQRLVLLTTSHQPLAGDGPGGRLCDADLSGLAAPWPQYQANTSGVRAEFAHLGENQWRHGRSGFIDRVLARETIYHTPFGRREWEQPARSNLRRELAALRR